MSMENLKPSRLFHFLDDQNNYAISFLEGQKIIHELILMHHYNPAGFQFFREVVLSGIHLIQFFKTGEQLGFYIDSDVPTLHFKLEANTEGLFRTLLVPEDIAVIPQKLSGILRLVKSTPFQDQPYQSILKISNSTLEEAVNEILKSSYQVEAEVLIANDSDQSIMVSKLPQSSFSKHEVQPLSPKDYLQSKKDALNAVLMKGINNEVELIAAMENHGFKFLQSTIFSFHCGCSREGMVGRIASLFKGRLEEIFDVEQEYIDLKCDYCNKKYLIGRDELTRFSLQ